MSGARECDVLVVGRGAAGSMMSILLAHSGADVIMVGREASATALSTGRIDLRGTAHTAELTTLLKRLGEGHGLFQEGGRSRRSITSHGTLIHQTLSSRHDWVISDLKEPVAVVGLKGNPDLEPLLVCAAMAGEGAAPRCLPYLSGLELPPSVPTDPEAEGGWGSVVDALASVIRDLDEPTAVIPPLFSGRGHSDALDILERTTGQRVREAATPLSNPGRRLQRCLEDGAVGAGCALWKGRELLSVAIENGWAIEVVLRSGLREQRLRPRAIVLATGGLVGGGMVPEGREVIDPLGLFSTAGSEARGIRSGELRRALSTGLRNDCGRVVLADGTAARNIFVAGSAVPGLSYPLGRGLGHVLDDAWSKAVLVREAL